MVRDTGCHQNDAGMLQHAELSALQQTLQQMVSFCCLRALLLERSASRQPQLQALVSPAMAQTLHIQCMQDAGGCYGSQVNDVLLCMPCCGCSRSTVQGS